MSRSRWPRRRRLARSLTGTLQAKAAQVQVTASTTPFDPDRPAPVDAADHPFDAPDTGGTSDALDRRDPARQEWQQAGRNPSGDHRQAPRQRLLSAAAVIVLVMLVGVAVVARHAGDDDRGSDVDTATPADGSETRLPSGALLPTWVPGDVEPWAVEWTRRTYPALPGDRYQLFGQPDEGRALLVWITPGELHDLGSGEQIAVRGLDGVHRPDIGAPREAASIVWSEDGASITAWFRGMAPAEAVAALEELEWRSGSYVDGFAAEEAGTYPLQDETSPTGSYDILATDLAYSDDIPTAAVADGQVLAIRTFTYSDAGGAAKDYLQDWFYGVRQSDGSAQSYDASEQSLRRSWPDGRSVQIDASGAVDQAALERIAASSRLGTSTDLAGLVSQADANLAALPVEASVDLPVGDVTVRGRAGFFALCLQVRPGAEPDCDPPAADQVWARQVNVAGSWVVGGAWYVASAATAPERAEVYDASHDAASDVLSPLPGENAHDGQWEVVLSQPPAGVDEVTTTAGFLSRPT